MKVNRAGYEPATLWNKASWFRRWRKSEDQFDKNYRDREVLARLEALNDPAVWKHLPRCYGWVQTDRGRGLVIELIRDPDGKISRSFKDYLWSSGYDERARKAVDDFAAYWDAFPIPTHTLSPRQVEALGIKPFSGGLQNLVVQGPDKKSYALSVRPLLPEETE